MQYISTPGTQGICPDGWHLPTEEEWCTLTQFLDPTVDCEYYVYNGTDAGIKMKTTSGWNSNGNGTNTSGFSGLPSGHRVFSGSFYPLLYDGYFWSSTQYNSYESWRWTLIFDGPGVTHISDGKSDYGNSVRCVKN